MKSIFLFALMSMLIGGCAVTRMKPEIVSSYNSGSDPASTIANSVNIDEFLNKVYNGIPENGPIEIFDSVSTDEPNIPNSSRLYTRDLALYKSYVSSNRMTLNKCDNIKVESNKRGELYIAKRGELIDSSVLFTVWRLNETAVNYPYRHIVTYMKRFDTERFMSKFLSNNTNCNQVLDQK